MLISVNPFKKMPLYDAEMMDAYIGKYPHEVSPHVYAIAEAAFRNMLNEEESQAVIISGESGAGKTEVSKQIMQFIAVVSGKAAGNVEHVKNIIIESNPLLEAFGNAKTLRNNNSSRFGKYFEIKFDMAGQPQGGAITNYLLEKSRIVFQQKGERNYHIFYQLINGAPSSAKKNLALTEIAKFNYLNVSGCYEIDHVDDAQEFEATRKAMKTVGMKGKEQEAIFTLVALILHLGNISFVEEKKGSEGVHCANQNQVVFAASLMQVDASALAFALTHRRIVSGNEEMNAVNNELQAVVVRDALAKSLYSKLFDWLVQRVNSAIVVADTFSTPFSIGVLDIYGFEIFNKNGFEQFCINFVNEKLQQIFIQLTLQQEQDEYVREGIEWTPIDYFNNRVVCELIEGTDGVKSTPGIFAILDDVCATMHAAKQGADRALVSKTSGVHAKHPHFMASSNGFVIKHYAGDVVYDCLDFADKNKDTLTRDIIAVVLTSTSPLIKVLFEDIAEEQSSAIASKKRPTTSGFKIKQQVALLVKTLAESEPHYVRCIKPNDEKKANVFTDARVLHQITYLGLLENVRVRRAGFAARIEFHKFLERFALCSDRTWPRPWTGDDKSGCKAILKEIAPQLHLKAADAQLGKTKIFLKQPEILLAMEEIKNGKLHLLATKIQRCWRRYKANRKFVELRLSMADFFTDKKDRRRNSLFRPYQGEYLALQTENYNTLRSIIAKYEPGSAGEEKGESAAVRRFRVNAEVSNSLYPIKAIFSDVVEVLGGSLKASDQRFLVVTTKFLYIFSYLLPTIGRTVYVDNSEPGKKQKKKKVQADDFTSKFGPSGQFILRQYVALASINSLSLSTLADNFLAIHLRDKATILEAPPWMADSAASSCMQCNQEFSLFNRRHHCRICGNIFCSLCSANYQCLPNLAVLQPPILSATLSAIDRTPWQRFNSHDPLLNLEKPESAALVHRVCDQCFGTHADEPFVDLLLNIEKKTELIGLLMKRIKGLSKNIVFVDNFKVGNNLILFQRDKRLHEGDFNVIQDQGKISFTVSSGLSSRLVAEKRAAERKRREDAEARAKKDKEFTRQRNLEREREREEERKLRIVEKKLRKAEQRARAEQEADAVAVRSKMTSQDNAPRLSVNVPIKKQVLISAVVNCVICGCADFEANLFKIGKCNRCFHVHV